MFKKLDYKETNLETKEYLRNLKHISWLIYALSRSKNFYFNY